MKISGYIYAPKAIEDQMNFLLKKAENYKILLPQLIENPNPKIRLECMELIANELRERTSDNEFHQIVFAQKEIKEYFEKQEEHFEKNGAYMTFNAGE